MRVNIEHRNKTVGLLRKVTQYDVLLTVDFSEEERAIIKEFHLENTCILEREIDSIRRRGFTPKEMIDLADEFNLTVRGLLRDHTDTFTFDQYMDARNYEVRVTEALKRLKDYLTTHTLRFENSKSFEL